MRSVLLLLGRVRAFVVRDFQLAVSYRLEFFMRILSILFVTTTLYFISQIFAGSGAQVVSCESERGTLFDVLETFERETGEGE